MVQTENISVAIVEGSDKALEIGAVVCKLYDTSAISQPMFFLVMIEFVLTLGLTFSKTVFCSVSVRGRILSVVLWIDGVGDAMR